MHLLPDCTTDSEEAYRSQTGSKRPRSLNGITAKARSTRQSAMSLFHPKRPKTVSGFLQMPVYWNSLVKTCRNTLGVLAHRWGAFLSSVLVIPDKNYCALWSSNSLMTSRGKSCSRSAKTRRRQTCWRKVESKNMYLWRQNYYENNSKIPKFCSLIEIQFEKPEILYL